MSSVYALEARETALLSPSVNFGNDKLLTAGQMVACLVVDTGNTPESVDTANESVVGGDGKEKGSISLRVIVATVM